uniref:Thrombomodulin n=1 Tax=Nothobranchius furzeri TaxID=105023 RepID=A0A8C6NRM3_NOTFU
MMGHLSEISVCVCVSGFEPSLDGTRCVDVDECAEEEDSCTEEGEECVNTDGGYECTCMEGFEEEDGACVNASICLLCEHSNCSRVSGEFRCVCRDGYRVSPRDPTRCDQYCPERVCRAVCHRDPDLEERDMQQCTCPDGYIVDLVNRTADCVDIDECEQQMCDHLCENTFGSYRCICFMDGACGCEHGFRLAEDGTSCVDFNECTNERQCPGENFMCVNTQLRYKCVCQVGFTSRRGLCVDRDECVSAPCEHECVNTPGSYRCLCYEGYRPDGTFCLEIDECAFSYCDQGCVNTFGGYVCSCDPGFKLVEEYRCVKTDEEGPEEGAPTPDPTSLNEEPDPTHRPSAITPGGLVGIIVCVVVLITLLVFAAHLGLRQRGRKSSSASGPLRAAGEDSHSLQRVRTHSHVDSF